MAPIVNVSAGWYNVPGQKCVSISALTLPPGSPRSGAPFNERSHEQNIGSRYRGGVAAG